MFVCAALMEDALQQGNDLCVCVCIDRSVIYFSCLVIIGSFIMPELPYQYCCLHRPRETAQRERERERERERFVMRAGVEGMHKERGEE